jgi:hypothetical protein
MHHLVFPLYVRIVMSVKIASVNKGSRCLTSLHSIVAASSAVTAKRDLSNKDVT